jgi:hypothetical protein
MTDITKEDLRSQVFITAHNAGLLTDSTQRQIDAFDPETYRQLLARQLAQRIAADRSGADGGGTMSAARLQEALDHLDHILSM